MTDDLLSVLAELLGIESELLDNIVTLLTHGISKKQKVSVGLATAKIVMTIE